MPYHAPIEPPSRVLSDIARTALRLKDQKQRLIEHLKNASPPPSPAPTFLHLGHIIKMPQLFQLRSPTEHHSRAHIRELAKAPNDNRHLASLTVWWAGDGWVLVDGYHRLEAYNEAGWEGLVPVTTLHCSLEDAVMTAARANCRPTLQMDKQERVNAAWLLTQRVEGTKASLAEAAGVCKRLIATMRATMQQLQKTHPRLDLGTMTWKEARRTAKEEDMDSTNWDDEDEEQIQSFATKLSRGFGTLSFRRMYLFAQALDRFDPRITIEVGRTLSRETLEDLLSTHEDWVYDQSDPLTPGYEENPDF